MLLSTTIEHFVLFKTSENLSARTLAWYHDTLRHFATWCEPTQSIQTVTPITVALYLSHERSRGLASVTVEGRYRALLAFFNWCEGSDLIPLTNSPLGHGHRKAIKRPRVDLPNLDFVHYDEYHAVVHAIDLANWLDYRDWSLISLMFWTGIRRSELLGLTIEDINLPEASLTLRITKARRPRVAPLHADLIAGLSTYLALRPAAASLWPAAQTLTPLTPAGLRQMLIRRCQRAGVRYLHPHLWRHGFAMTLLNDGGAELSSVSKLLGHSSVKVTERHYATWLTDPLRRAYLATVERITNR